MAAVTHSGRGRAFLDLSLFLQTGKKVPTLPVVRLQETPLEFLALRGCSVYGPQSYLSVDQKAPTWLLRSDFLNLSETRPKRNNGYNITYSPDQAFGSQVPFSTWLFKQGSQFTERQGSKGVPGP